MNVIVISIGDELLIGQTVNTNASWIGQEISKIGGNILEGLTISDKAQEILTTVEYSINMADVIIITGGLGPTKDDITKHTLASYFDTELEIHQPTLDKITAYFSMRKRPMIESNIQQAALPKNCTILTNNYGTAAGMWFEKNGKIVISLPGVPYEMKGIMSEEVFPRMKERFQLNSMYHKTILTQGIGESFLAEQLTDWESRVRAEGFGLAYLPSPGIVKLRISSPNGEQDKAIIEDYLSELKNTLPEAVFGYENETLPEIIGKILRENNLKIGTVESCTSGLLANQIVSVSGASDYFEGSLLTYSYKLKEEILGISKTTLRENGAVSEIVALQMAEKGLEKLDVDICLSTTGIAGPLGGTDDKPVGLVWIGLATKNGVKARKFQFGDNRERNLQMTVLSALNWLRYELLTDFKTDGIIQ
jgi:nicotinamide-nucleotide amidase